MPQIKRKAKPKPKPNPLDGVEFAIVTSPFHPAPISRLLEVGDHIRLDTDIVRRNPSRFAIPLTALLDPSQEE